MKKFVVPFVWSLLAAPWVFAADSAAAEKPSAAPAPLCCFSLGADLSYWNIQDLNDFDVDGALGGGVIGEFRLHDFLAIDLRLSGYATGYSEDAHVEGEGWFENEFTIVAMPMEAGLVGFLPLGETFSLYGGPGVGYYLFDGQFRSSQGPRETIYDIELEDEGGYYALVGLRARLARNLALFVEGKYTWVESSFEQAIEPVEEIRIRWSRQDIDFSGLAINAGMTFNF